LEQALAKPAKGPGGRPANDPLKMFKLLVVQRYYNLSDEQTEYQVNDRLSFQKFAGWTVADKVPAANPIWDFREALVKAGVHERAYRNRPLSDEQKESNRQKSKIRARIEPVFGFMSQSMKGFYLH
jgi:IS5 family transposase